MSNGRQALLEGIKLGGSATSELKSGAHTFGWALYIGVKDQFLYLGKFKLSSRNQIRATAFSNYNTWIYLIF